MYEIISLLYKSTQRFSMIIKSVNLVCKILDVYYVVTRCSSCLWKRSKEQK